MKKTILILLCFLMTIVLGSCNKNADTDSKNIEMAGQISDISLNQPNNEKKLSSNEAYHDILSTYQEFLILKKNNTNYDKLYLEQHKEENKIEAAVFHAVLRNFPEKMGYAMKDLNGDEAEELILLDDDYHIYTIFTILDGQPKIIDDAFFGDGNYTGAIGPDGTIYKDGYGKGENLYRYAMKISNEGTLFGMEFGCLDVDINDIEVEYYKIIDGERINIDASEFEFLNKDYYRIVGNHTELTKNSNIEFIPSLT